VATNLAIDHIRRRERRPAFELAELVEVVENFADALVERDVVPAAIGQLPPRQRDVVVLRHVAGMSQLEIAAACGIARSTAAVHLARGEATLRSLLDHDRPTGVVSSQVAFGWFVDLEVGTGLVHRSAVGCAPLAIGARVVVAVDGVDVDAERISLHLAPER